MAQKLSDVDFAKNVTNSKGYVLIDFWAEWCGPCRQLGPHVDELAKEMANQVQVYKMNVDENPEMPSKLGIRGIPALILFQDGKQIATKVGAMPKNTLFDWVKSEIGEANR